MTILVTGANGIVGRPLVKLLLSRGHKVIGLCRHPDRSVNVSGLQWLEGDVSKQRLGQSEENWQNLCREVNTIFHLAARTDFKGQSIEEYRPTNIDGVRHIKELAMAAEAWLHHVSTAFVCGKWLGEFSESQLEEGQAFHNSYEESKYLGELLLRQEPGPQYTIYRPAIILERQPTSASPSVFGPFAFIDAVFRLCLGAVKKGGELQTIRVQGNPKAHLPLVFDDEVAQTLAILAERHAVHGATFHLTPAKPLPNRILEQVFNQAFSRKAAVWVDREILQKEISTLEIILAKKTKSYSPYLDLQVTFTRSNLEKALGSDILPAIDEEALFSSFALFLAAKKELETVVTYNEQFHLHYYFSSFLGRYLGRRLIRNLASLSACLQIEIKEYTTWTITIENGVLTKITEGSSGDFGYITDGPTFLQVASGRISPQQGFFQGGIQLVAKPKEALRTAAALEEFFQHYPYVGAVNTITERQPDA
jgi:nucleoside-diphosphate-sugar epimerase